jgi:hypothetical protein
MIFPAQLPQQPAMNLPPTFHAGQLIISSSVGEISVTFGHTRMSPTVQNGVNTAIPFVEWYSTITLSAPVAQQLADGLKQALEQYTALFGKIPKQPPVPPPAKKQQEEGSSPCRHSDVLSEDAASLTVTGTLAAYSAKTS